MKKIWLSAAALFLTLPAYSSPPSELPSCQLPREPVQCRGDQSYEKAKSVESDLSKHCQDIRKKIEELESAKDRLVENCAKAARSQSSRRGRRATGAGRHGNDEKADLVAGNQRLLGECERRMQEISKHLNTEAQKARILKDKAESSGQSLNGTTVKSECVSSRDLNFLLINNAKDQAEALEKRARGQSSDAQRMAGDYRRANQTGGGVRRANEVNRDRFSSQSPGGKSPGGQGAGSDGQDQAKQQGGQQGGGGGGGQPPQMPQKQEQQQAKENTGPCLPQDPRPVCVEVERQKREKEEKARLDEEEKRRQMSQSTVPNVTVQK
jgi:hypothetical protein